MEYRTNPKTKAKKKLLIVDDLDQIRDAFRMVLEDYFEIEDFGSGEEALASFRAFHPDVVFLDIDLEGSKKSLQGPDLLKIMKKERKQTVVCMVSAHEELKGRMLLLGADGFITKPCGRGELFDFLIAKGLMEPTM